MFFRPKKQVTLTDLIEHALQQCATG